MSSAVSVKGVSKAFGKLKALDNVSFDVPEHSVFGLLGPNGAGKTTLFSVMAGFLKADSGQITVLGNDVRHISELQGRMTILPQDAAFQRNTPIVEQLVFFRLLDGRSREEAEKDVEHALSLVGLSDYARRGARVLSHGMTKRLGIAQAFLGSPEVILLDEPTAGLDPANARQIRNLVEELRQRATVIVSSHNLAELQELCDHVAILDHGKLVTSGSVEELTATSRELNLSLKHSLDPEQLAGLEGLIGVTSVDDSVAPKYTIGLDLGDDRNWDGVVGGILRHLLDAGIAPRGLQEGQSLERHFLSVTGKKDSD